MTGFRSKKAMAMDKIQSYRRYYYGHAMRQISVALHMLWHGVILNKGHHSNWSKK